MHCSVCGKSVAWWELEEHERRCGVSEHMAGRVDLEAAICEGTGMDADEARFLLDRILGSAGKAVTL